MEAITGEIFHQSQSRFSHSPLEFSLERKGLLIQLALHTCLFKFRWLSFSSWYLIQKILEVERYKTDVYLL